jgi:hypothetical protein
LFRVTANATAEWISRQITEAFPWGSAPHYLIRDRDTEYGPVFVQRLRVMGYLGPADLCSIGRLSASALSHYSLSSAAFITNIAESDFRYAQDASVFPASSMIPKIDFSDKIMRRNKAIERSIDSM